MAQAIHQRTHALGIQTTVTDEHILRRLICVLSAFVFHHL
jgi:hypothetical protein